MPSAMPLMHDGYGRDADAEVTGKAPAFSECPANTQLRYLHELTPSKSTTHFNQGSVEATEPSITVSSKERRIAGCPPSCHIAKGLEPLASDEYRRLDGCSRATYKGMQVNPHLSIRALLTN